jgi:hypothetical protein
VTVSKWRRRFAEDRLEGLVDETVEAVVVDTFETAPDDATHVEDDPKPFVWHKTAEQILDRLAGYCHAITQGA